MGRIADGLREYAASLREDRQVSGAVPHRLEEIANEIDAEHESRLEQSRLGTKRAFEHYMSSVLNDYRHGTKRVARRKALAVDLGGRRTCGCCGGDLGAEESRFCPHCGAMMHTTTRRKG